MITSENHGQAWTRGLNDETCSSHLLPFGRIHHTARSRATHHAPSPGKEPYPQNLVLAALLQMTPDEKLVQDVVSLQIGGAINAEYRLLVRIHLCTRTLDGFRRDTSESRAAPPFPLLICTRHSWASLAPNYLVKVENDVQLADISKIPVQNLHKQMDHLRGRA